MTLALAFLVCLLVAIAVAAITDRNARATAWRQIALERRWNHENERPDRH